MIFSIIREREEARFRGDDVDQPRNTNKNPSHVSNSPITQSKTKGLKEKFNALVLKVQSS